MSISTLLWRLTRPQIARVVQNSATPLSLSIIPQRQLVLSAPLARRRRRTPQDDPHADCPKCWKRPRFPLCEKKNCMDQHLRKPKCPGLSKCRPNPCKTISRADVDAGREIEEFQLWQAREERRLRKRLEFKRKHCPRRRRKKRHDVYKSKCPKDYSDPRKYGRKFR